MTKRMWTLVIGVVLAAMPLVWLSTDASAGDKLLRLTQSKSVHWQ